MLSQGAVGGGHVAEPGGVTRLAEWQDGIGFAEKCEAFCSHRPLVILLFSIEVLAAMKLEQHAPDSRS